MTVLTIVECEGDDTYICKLGNTPDMKGSKYTFVIDGDLTVAAAYEDVLHSFLALGLLPLVSHAQPGKWLVVQNGQILDF